MYSEHADLFDSIMQNKQLISIYTATKFQINTHMHAQRDPTRTNVKVTLDIPYFYLSSFQFMQRLKS